jgi:hypothetical protein
MTPMQRRAAADRARDVAKPKPGQSGFWQAASSLTISGVYFRAGCVIDTEIVAKLPAQNVGALVANGMIMWRLGPLPTSAPVPEIVKIAPPVDHREALVRNHGYNAWDVDASVNAPHGAWRPPVPREEAPPVPLSRRGANALAPKPPTPPKPETVFVETPTPYYRDNETTKARGEPARARRR